MNRNVIDKKYKWNLQAIYKDEQEFNDDYLAVKEKISNIKKYENIFLNSAKDLYEFLEYDSALGQILEKLYSYTSLYYDEETSNNKAQELRGKIKNLYEEYENNTSFVRPKLLKLEKKELQEFYNSYKPLSKYQIMLNKIYRYKEHTLDEKSESLLSSLNKIFNKSAETYEILTDSDLIYMMNKVQENLVPYEPGNLILTDDKAPVELLGMKIIDELIAGEVAYYKNIYEKDGLDGLLELL